MFAKRIIVLAAAFLLVVLLVGCFSPGSGGTRGNGRMVDGSFSHDGSITRIVVSDLAATVNIRPESSRAVTYTIDENLMDLLELTYQNGELRIATRGNRSITSNTGITFDVGADALQEIVVAGAAASIQGSGIFSAEVFALEINDAAANAELALDVQRATVEVTGAADVTFSGVADELIINASGAVNVNSRNLIAQNATVTLEGVGAIQVYAAATLDASVEGVGSVTYWGNPVLTSSVAGMAEVRRGD